MEKRTKCYNCEKVRLCTQPFDSDAWLCAECNAEMVECRNLESITHGN